MSTISAALTRRARRPALALLASGAVLVSGTATAGAAVPAAPAAPAASSTNQILADPHSIGSITLLDASGHAVTGGSTAVPLKSLAASARASGPNPTGYDEYSVLTMWVPEPGVDESQWSGAPLSLSYRQPAGSASAPATVVGLDSGSIERDLYEASGPSTGDVANLYELRMYGVVDGPEDSSSWYSAIMQVDPTSRTWHIVSEGGGGVPASTVMPGTSGAIPGPSGHPGAAAASPGTPAPTAATVPGGPQAGSGKPLSAASGAPAAVGTSPAPSGSATQPGTSESAAGGAGTTRSAAGPAGRATTPSRGHTVLWIVLIVAIAAFVTGALSLVRRRRQPTGQ